MNDREPREPITMSRGTLRRLGTASWLWLGILLLSAVIYMALVQLAGLVVPLIVAAVIGILFVPLVDRLERWMPRALGSWLVLLGSIALVLGTAWLTVDGIVDQLPQIEEQIIAGLGALGSLLSDLGFEGTDLTESFDGLEGIMHDLGGGLAGFIGSAFSSLAAFIAGSFASLFLLYFILQDWEVVSTWSTRHLGVGTELGKGILRDTTWAMRGYFYVLTVSAFVGGIFVWIMMSALGLPLAFTVALVTFLTSYVPYLGAIVSGVFAFLVALGAGGMPAALLVTLVIVLSQTIVQPLIQVKITEQSLELHPIVSFASTIVGSAIAGLLGATLSAPLVAMFSKVRRRVREHRPAADEMGPESIV